jgi:hypothetical protein
MYTDFDRTVMDENEMVIPSRYLYSIHYRISKAIKSFVKSKIIRSNHD